MPRIEKVTCHKSKLVNDNHQINLKYYGTNSGAMIITDYKSLKMIQKELTAYIDQVEEKLKEARLKEE